MSLAAEPGFSISAIKNNLQKRKLTNRLRSGTYLKRLYYCQKFQNDRMSCCDFTDHRVYFIYIMYSSLRLKICQLDKKFGDYINFTRLTLFLFQNLKITECSSVSFGIYELEI